MMTDAQTAQGADIATPAPVVSPETGDGQQQAQAAGGLGTTEFSSDGESWSGTPGGSPKTEEAGKPPANTGDSAGQDADKGPNDTKAGAIEDKGQEGGKQKLSNRKAKSLQWHLDSLRESNKRLFRELEQLKAAAGNQPRQAAEDGKPDPASYKTVGEYIEALAEHKANAALGKFRQDQGQVMAQQAQIRQVASAWEQQIRDDIEDRDSYNEAIKALRELDIPGPGDNPAHFLARVLGTQTMGYIPHLSHGPRVMQYLGEHLDLAQQLPRLHPSDVVDTLRKINVFVSSQGRTVQPGTGAQPAGRSSAAKAPPPPVGSLGGGGNSVQELAPDGILDDRGLAAWRQRKIRI